jgi:hypothetical protein
MGFNTGNKCGLGCAQAARSIGGVLPELLRGELFVEPQLLSCIGVFKLE